MSKLPENMQRLLAGATHPGEIALPTRYDRLSARERVKVREQYIERQFNLCTHCHGRLDLSPPPEILSLRVRMEAFPPGFLNNPIHLHHSHRTGLTIGAVHAYCNAVLWQYHGE